MAPPAGVAVPLAMLLAVLLAAPAVGHARLLSSSPQGGAVVDGARRVVLTFSETVEAEFAQVQVTGPDGSRVDAGAPRVEGRVVSVPLQSLDEAGSYNVAFRVVSADGHPIESTFAFEVRGVAGQRPPAREKSAQRPSGDQDVGAGRGGPSVALLVLAVLGGVTLLAGAVYAVVRRHASAPPPS